MSSRSVASIAVATLAVAALGLAGCSNSQKDSDKQVDTATGVAVATATTSASHEASSTAAVAEGVAFENAYIRAKGTDSSMTAIFGDIVNNTDQPVVLESFSSKALGNVTYELHEVVDGVMQEHEGGFEIPAHSTFSLKPGADHLMVMNISRAIEAGDTIDLTLHFENEDVTIDSLAVRTTASGGESYSEDGNLESHGGMTSTSAAAH